MDGDGGHAASSAAGVGGGTPTPLQSAACCAFHRIVGGVPSSEPRGGGCGRHCVLFLETGADALGLYGDGKLYTSTSRLPTVMSFGKRQVPSCSRRCCRRAASFGGWRRCTSLPSASFGGPVENDHLPFLLPWPGAARHSVVRTFAAVRHVEG